LISQGLSNEQIAERLVLTPGTVANHVGHILAKLGLHSRVEIAVKIASEKGNSNTETILGLLETLREVDSTTAREAMTHATNVLAAAFDADKVDAFFYDATTDMLVALGTSQTRMGKRQQELGLHRLQVSNGGRAAWVFREKRAFRDGHVDKDELELLGVRHDLRVRSTIAVPIEVGSTRHGVLMASSAQPEHFVEDQLHLLQFVAYWIGLVARDQS
jgi:two-component system, OmpR family, sensor kinase